MANDEQAAQKARADRIRQQIERLKVPEEKGEENASPAKQTEKESPRDFIHRKMDELEK